LFANEDGDLNMTSQIVEREGLSISEACAMAGIGRTKIYEAISDGSLKARKCGNGRLIENVSDETWAPGSGLEAFDTAGWPDNRAGFVLEALGSLDLDTTVTSMPDEVRGWITHAATA
jgi:excisionase family DNA binding protein